MLALRDERLREAYSSDEIELFRGVAASIGVTLQNSQVYERMKERDRLAALGQMAAGLAHEIRNPLGSIKGAAQFSSPSAIRCADGGTKEFLDIIVEEVNRLNKIVSQFLDYARPYRGEQTPLDVNDVVRKTLQLLEKEEGAARVEIADQPRRRTADGARRCRAAAAGVPEPGHQRRAGHAQRRAAAGLDQLRAIDPAGSGGGVPRGALSRHRGRHSGGGCSQPLHPVLHHQGEGDRAGFAHQPAHHREPRRDHRSTLAARGGRHLHGLAADRGGRVRQLHRPAQGATATADLALRPPLSMPSLEPMDAEETPSPVRGTK